MTATSSRFNRRVIAVMIYSLIYPLTQAMSGPFIIIGALATLPFMPIAYICGMAMASTFGSEAAYIVGASIAIFLQVWLLVIVRPGRAQKKRVTDTERY